MKRKLESMLVVTILFFFALAGCGPPTIKIVDRGLNAAEKKCLRDFKGKLGEALMKLRIDLSGKTITLRLDKNLKATAETLPDLADGKKVIMKISPQACGGELSAETLLRVAGHELVHVQDLTASTPHPTRVLFGDLEKARGAFEAARKDPRVTFEKRRELEKKVQVAGWLYIRQLKKDEERAYDATKSDHKTKLGLGNAEVTRNDNEKKAALRGLDRTLGSTLRRLRSFRIDCAKVELEPIAVSTAQAKGWGRKRACVPTGTCKNDRLEAGGRAFCAAADLPLCMLCGSCTMGQKCQPALLDAGKTRNLSLTGCKTVADPTLLCAAEEELCECGITAQADARLACSCSCL